MYRMLTQEEGLVAHGVSTCAGCAMELIFRNVMDVMGEDTVIVIPPGCAAIFSGYGDVSSLKISGFQGNLENSAANAVGIRAGLDAQGKTSTHVLAFAGDGGTIDIGLQSLSGAMERHNRIIYICYDNEAYMNTGIQASGSTPALSKTTTTPSGKRTGKKDLVQIAIAHNITYAATASVCNIRDLRKKVEHAKTIDGPVLIHVHAPCPTGWFYNPAKTVEIAKEAVESGCWILYEYENGRTKINYLPRNLHSIDRYVSLQGRFKHLTEEQRETMQQDVRKQFNRYKKLLEFMSAEDEEE